MSGDRRARPGSDFWAHGPAERLRVLDQKESERLRVIDEQLRRADPGERHELEEQRRAIVDRYAEKRRQIDSSLF